MEEASTAMSVPLDSNGFLRRECPNCSRQFKWRQTSSDELTTEAPTAVNAYFCPYCHEPAAPDAWWTQEQLEHARQLIMTEIAGPKLRRFKRQIESASRRRGGLRRIEVQLPSLSRPAPLGEPDDMVRVDFPCHPEEPIKVDNTWEHEVACLVCGIRYPVDLVRALPEPEPDEGGPS